MKIRIKYNFQNFIGGEILKKCGIKIPTWKNKCVFNILSN